MGTDPLRTSYVVRFRPQLHQLEVVLTLEGLPAPGPVLLATPTWVPGAYGFMKYGRDVFDLTARDPASGAALAWRREGWSGYLVEAVSTDLEVAWSVCACDPAWSELAGFVDGHQALFLGTRCLYAPAYPGPCRVRYEVPPGWGFHHPSGATPIEGNTFDYPSHPAFLDSPVVLGTFQHFQRTCREVTFHFVFLDWNLGFDARVQPFMDGVMGIAEACHGVFGAFPFEDFTFIYSFDPRAQWGMEHANATTIGLGADVFIDPKAFADGLRVSAHELFHAWNCCRLKPAPLGDPDLLRGGFPDVLWVTEGFTRYYEFLLCVRSGAIPVDAFFSNIVNYYRQHHLRPAARRVSAVDSSRATFLNHNRYPGSVNSTIDYYDQGMLVAFDLDVALRTRAGSNLDEELRALYEAHAGVGKGLTHAQARDFFLRRAPMLADQLTRETETSLGLGVEEALEHLGFKLGREAAPYVGLVLAKNEGPGIADVLDTYPAGVAGLAPGDELLFLEGFPFSLKALNWLIAQKATFTLEVQRGQRRLAFEITPMERPRISSLTWDGTPGQRESIQSWLGRPDFAPKIGDRILLEAFDNFHGIQTVL